MRCLKTFPPIYFPPEKLTGLLHSWLCWWYSLHSLQWVGKEEGGVDEELPQLQYNFLPSNVKAALLKYSWSPICNAVVYTRSPTMIPPTKMNQKLLIKCVEKRENNQLIPKIHSYLHLRSNIFQVYHIFPTPGVLLGFPSSSGGLLQPAEVLDLRLCIQKYLVQSWRQCLGKDPRSFSLVRLTCCLSEVLFSSQCERSELESAWS